MVEILAKTAMLISKQTNKMGYVLELLRMKSHNVLVVWKQPLYSNIV